MHALLTHLLDIVLAIVAVLAGAVGIFWALLRLSEARRTPSRRRGLEAAGLEPGEPGWTEAIASDGALVYGRAQSFHAQLAHEDARGRRGEFTLHTD